MPPDDIASINRRLERIELALSRLGGTGSFADLGPIVDPPPDDWGRWRPQSSWRSQLIDLLRGRIPIPWDPAPDDLARFPRDSLRARIGELFARNPGWFVDPPPEDFLNVRLLDLIRRWRGGFTDPAPEDLANVRLRDILQRVPGGGFTDPSPDDLSRLTKTELEAQVHKVGAELVRLKSLERTLNEKLSTTKS